MDIGVTLLLLVGFPQDSAAARLPIPDAGQLKEAEKLVREVLKEEYAKKGPENRRILLKRLLLQAVDTKDDASAAYFMLREAQAVAAEVGDVRAGLTAVDALAKGYDVDAVGVRTAFLGEAAKAAKAPAVHKDLAEAHLTLVAHAMEKEDFTLAERSAKEAAAFARKAKELALVGQADAGLKAIATAKARAEAAKVARQTLLKDPADPAANLIVGRFECFIAGRWDVGLPHLAQAEDATLKDVAKKDLALPQDAQEQLDLADAWWSIGEKEAGEAKTKVQRRAAAWYAKARGRLNGLAKTKADKRAAILGELPLEDVVSTADLVAWWTFDEGKGATTADTSPSSVPMTLVAGAAWTSGTSGSALDLNGVTAYGTLAAGPAQDPGSDSWTVACFVRTRGREPYRLVNKWNNPGHRGWILDLNTGANNLAAPAPGALRVRLDDGTFSVDHSIDIGLAPDIWTHVAFVLNRSSGELKLYASGSPLEPAAKLNSLGSLGNTNPIVVGVLPTTTGNRALFGAVDDLRIYRRALSDAEIKTVSRAK